MDWSDIGAKILKSAPIVGGLLGGPVGATVGTAANLVAGWLGVEPTPEAVEQALQKDPEALVKLKENEQRYQAKLTELQLAAETAQLTEINKTMRAELASDSLYKSGWRPLFGYVMATAWAAIMFAVTYLMVTDPGAAAAVLVALSDTTVLWGIGLSVLGINIGQRSKDKALKAGQPQAGLLSSILSSRQ